MKNLDATNSIHWCGTTSLNCYEEGGLKAEKKMPTLFGEFSNAIWSQSNLLHECNSNGLFIGDSGECWAIVLTDAAPEEEKKVFTLFHRATDVVVTFSQLQKSLL